MRNIGIAIVGLIAFYFFISDRSTAEAATVLTAAATFYAAITVFLLRE